MNQEIKENLVAILTEIANAKNFTTNTDIGTVFMSAETIISTLAYLVGPIAEMEQKYRKLAMPQKIEITTNGKVIYESVAAAENRAKASDEYKEWRKAVRTVEIADEQIMLLKKFREDLQKEYQRT